MPPASSGPAAAQRADHPPDPSPLDPGRPAAGSTVLAAEREHLRKSREFLGLMRTDVLSLRALGGDPVSEEYLKADLYRRAEALKDLPDTPLFFGRLDYRAGALAAPGAAEDSDLAAAAAAHGDEPSGEHFHVGRRHVHDPQGTPVVIDWRAPVSRPFYRASQGEPMGLDRRRRFGFAGGELTAYEDERFGRDGQADLGTSQQDPDRGDRAPAHRADARHRRHDPARPGRHRPGRGRADRVRAGRAGHRQDRGRPAPGRVPAVRARAAAQPRRRARGRAERRRSSPTSRTCCPPSASSTSPSSRSPTCSRRCRCAAPDSDLAAPGQGRRPDGRGAPAARCGSR